MRAVRLIVWTDDFSKSRRTTDPTQIRHAACVGAFELWFFFFFVGVLSVLQRDYDNKRDEFFGFVTTGKNILGFTVNLFNVINQSKRVSYGFFPFTNRLKKA